MLSKILKNDRVEVVFSIRAYEGEREAHLVGDFNDWQIGATPMQRSEKGRWEATAVLPVDREFRFRYLINEQKWHNDPDADTYVTGEDGMLQSVVSTAVALPDHRTTQKHFASKRWEGSAYRRVLLPFTCSQHFHSSLKPMLDMIRRLSPDTPEENPELIFLRVRGEEGDCQDREQIYSELRGVRARLQSYALPARIDTVSGPTARSIVDYAGRHAIDLILLPKRHKNAETDIVDMVAQSARCDTLIMD